jgi:hypothetical protein
MVDNLGNDEQNQRGEEQRGAVEIAPVQRHGDGVAAGLAQCRCRDFDDPEDEGDLGNLVRRFGHLAILFDGETTPARSIDSALSRCSICDADAQAFVGNAELQ